MRLESIQSSGIASIPQEKRDGDMSSLGSSRKRRYLDLSTMDALMESALINEFLLTEIQTDIADKDSGRSMLGQKIRHNGPSRHPLLDNATFLHGIALRNLNSSLEELQGNLFIMSNPTELSLLYRELAIHVQDLGILLALSPQIIAIVDVSRLIRLLTHMLSATSLVPNTIVSEAVQQSALYFYGGLFASHRGIVETTNALEDADFEKVWLKCWFGEDLNEHSLVGDIRRAHGVLSLAEEIQRCSRNFSLPPPVNLPLTCIGTAITSLLDCWRTSQILLQLHLGDMEQVRRQSDIISRGCLELAKLCTYECGREALCAAVIETRLPLFFIALERHSTAQLISETARYLAIQILHTGIQYRSLLSPAGTDILSALFRHIEPSNLSRLLFSQPDEQRLTTQIDVLLESIDHPNRLRTEVDFTCQLCVSLSSLAAFCSHPLHCSSFIVSLSERRLPYSSIALVCAALDEVVNAISMVSYGDELSPGYLRYARPPYPLLSFDTPANGTKILQESDAKIFNFRSALSLYDILLCLLHLCSDSSGSDGIIAISSICQPSIDYIVKTCLRTINVCHAFEEPGLSLSSKLERTCQRVLTNLAAIGFPSDLTLTSSMNRDTMEMTIRELLAQGCHSPSFCNTSGKILCSLVRGWRSEEILVNNQLVSEFRRCLQKLRPELSDWLSVWDGDSMHIQWMAVGGQEVMETVWDEVFSRIEVWVYRGHSRYALKWLGVLRSMLVQCKDKISELELLNYVVSARYLGSSFQTWMQRIVSMLPESDVESPEMELVWRLCEDLAIGNFTKSSGASPEDIEDLIYVNCADYLENIVGSDQLPTQRPASPMYWRGRLSPETGISNRDEDRQSPGQGPLAGASVVRNGGGGKIYTQNEFRSAHGTSRNTSRAPSVHVDDFYSNT